MGVDIQILPFLVIIARLARSKIVLGEWTSGPTTAVYGFAAGWTTYAADDRLYAKENEQQHHLFTMILGAAGAMAAIGDPAWKTYYDENSIGGFNFAASCS
ncbi:ASN_HP2_G0014620.mRNA.1.CDS.1 [Saccharomyces cerevisiae]|nr:ASN_HP2_G0014620.mRNA.1.CDS.1 [Saccharomyces cerevisiae]CAI6548831.1 ASN_HP2_G0014620.mRNA.1.CDS.1 [Saccharomyces cerevisiae]